MMRKTQLDQMRQAFDKQFEPDGEGYLFRARPKAAAIRVTAADRDRLVKDFDRTLWQLSWIGIPATIVFAFAVIAGMAWLDVQEPWTTVLTVLAAVGGPALLGGISYWRHTHPARVLRRRPR